MAGSPLTFPPPAWTEYQRHRSEIAAMLDPRCYSINWLDVQLLAGLAAAKGNDTAAIVFTVKTYPAGATELHGLVAAGELAGILDLIEQTEAEAREAGVTFACIASRPGWARVLKTKGYEMHQTELRKELRHGHE